MMFASEKVAKHEAERHARLTWAPEYDMTPSNPATPPEIAADREIMDSLRERMNQVRADWRAENGTSPAPSF